MLASSSIRSAAPLLPALLPLIALVTGCATSPPPAAPQPPADAPRPAPDELVPVLRYGRYTLVELTADSPQRTLMQQVIDVTIPATANATVGEALRYVLLRSGYQLCENSPYVRRLDALPLPAAHLHLGPIMLGDALRLLVGATGDLQVDEGTRRVCIGSNAEAHEDATIGRAAEIPEAHP